MRNKAKDFRKIQKELNRNKDIPQVGTGVIAPKMEKFCKFFNIAFYERGDDFIISTKQTEFIINIKETNRFNHYFAIQVNEKCCMIYDSAPSPTRYYITKRAQLIKRLFPKKRKVYMKCEKQRPTSYDCGLFAAYFIVALKPECNVSSYSEIKDILLCLLASKPLRSMKT